MLIYLNQDVYQIFFGLLSYSNGKGERINEKKKIVTSDSLPPHPQAQFCVIMWLFASFYVAEGIWPTYGLNGLQRVVRARDPDCVYLCFFTENVFRFPKKWLTDKLWNTICL